MGGETNVLLPNILLVKNRQNIYAPLGCVAENYRMLKTLFFCVCLVLWSVNAQKLPVVINTWAFVDANEAGTLTA